MPVRFSRKRFAFALRLPFVDAVKQKRDLRCDDLDFAPLLCRECFLNRESDCLCHGPLNPIATLPSLESGGALRIGDGKRDLGLRNTQPLSQALLRSVSDEQLATDYR